MISYYIESKPSDKALVVTQKALDPSKEDDREPYFRRMLKRCPYSVGKRVRIPNTATKGVVESIIRDFKSVKWEDNEAHFIVVKWNDGSKTVYSPHKLTMKRAR